MSRWRILGFTTIASAGIACGALAGMPVRGDTSPVPPVIYEWDAQLLRLPTTSRPANVIAATHNGWHRGKSEATVPGDLKGFAQHWRCDLESERDTAILWDRLWAHPHPADASERWLDLLRQESIPSRKSLLSILDEHPGVEQWSTMATLLPRHRKLLARLIDGKVAASLHFWLRLRPAARLAATRNPAPLGTGEADLAKEAGLREAALDPKERETLAPLTQRYYLSARRPRVAPPPDGDWSRLPPGQRPRFTPQDPLFLYVSSPERTTGERRLSLRTYRQGPKPAGQLRPLPGIWIAHTLPHPWDIAFPRIPERGESSGWTPAGLLSLSREGSQDKIRLSGHCFTRPLRQVLGEIGALSREKLRAERDLADRTVTLLLSGIAPGELKKALARAFHARWSRTGKKGSEVLVLELTPEARRQMQAAAGSAVSGDPERLANGSERIQLRKDLEDALPPERRAELARLEAEGSEASIRMSFAEFPPSLQRRLADQAHYERWFSERRNGLPPHLLVDTSRLDDIQVSFRMEGGHATFWVYRLPLTGGGYLEY